MLCCGLVQLSYCPDSHGSPSHNVACLFLAAPLCFVNCVLCYISPINCRGSHPPWQTNCNRISSVKIKIQVAFNFMTTEHGIGLEGILEVQGKKSFIVSNG
uniref:Uncharacterized protein n=1 Tax=Micrurus spixii TaxID=129469 RepID=A0A2D4N7T0_9SAUR